ncbi:ABC transporter permease [Halobellus clavatus]|uniref:ABC-2 type transport system permease protein n=1 Tax=Halobellus clavatus TaxID=660517 RepID=A0A1H3E2X6_9EURY|nr:ABC transporter permease subunit [Halobellus clavatus]SDX73031.1 ABC-2 type transport system permease protein [Halobellus clavatus]
MFLAIYRKTLGDLSEPKAILTYLLVFVSVLWFLLIGFGNNEIPDAVAKLPLAEQELELLTAYVPLTWLWGVGIGLLVAGALFVALTLATEADRGTLDLLLSKPVRRWEVLLAIFLANVTFLFAVAVASLLLVAVFLYQMGGFSTAALGGGVFAVLPATLVYALFVSAFVNAVGMAASVATRNRLQTAALTAVVPALFFVLFVARLVPGSIYEDYSLYMIDVSYHLGNVYALLLGTLGDPLPVELQAQLGFWAGVYEVPQGQDALGESLELVGYVDPVVSLALCVCLTLGLLAVALVQFQRLDV